jgi:hypothetical protein
MFTIEALNILLFLIPGLYVVLFVDTFSIRKREPTALDKFAESLVLSLVVYAIYSRFFDAFDSIDLGSDLVVAFADFNQLFTLLAISTALALVITYAKRYDTHMWLMRKAKATKLTSRKSTWQEVFDSTTRNIIIELKDGRVIAGYPLFYEDSSEGALVIESPKLVNGGTYSDMGSKALLLTTKADIKMVNFLRSIEEEGIYQDGQRKIEQENLDQ